MDTLQQIKTDWREHGEGNDNLLSRVTYGFDTDFSDRNNRSPYFSLTVETYRQIAMGEKFRECETIIVQGIRYIEEAFGQCLDTVREVFPELVPLMPWHLVSIDKGPMYYIANGMYWLREQREKEFKSTILFNRVSTDGIEWDYPRYDLVTLAMQCRNAAVRDYITNPHKVTRACVASWELCYSNNLDDVDARIAAAPAYLTARLPELMIRFREVMVRYGLLVTSEEE